MKAPSYGSQVRALAAIFLQPLRGQVSSALWGYLHEQIGNRCEVLRVSPDEAARMIVLGLQTADALTERETKTLRVFLGMSQ